MSDSFDRAAAEARFFAAIDYDTRDIAAADREFRAALAEIDRLAAEVERLTAEYARRGEALAAWSTAAAGCSAAAVDLFRERERLFAEFARLRADLAACRAALEDLAALKCVIEPHYPDEWPLFDAMSDYGGHDPGADIRCGAVRRAAAVLARGESEEDRPC